MIHAIRNRALVDTARCSGSYDFRPRRRCVHCGEAKPLKGGRTNNGSRFTCAECVAKGKRP